MAALVLLLCSLATSLFILTLKSHALDELQQQRSQGRLQRWQAAGGRVAPPPPGAAARLQVRGGLLLLGGHLVAMLLRTDRSRLTEPAGLAGEAAVPLVLGLLLVALPALLPRTFERHHTLLVGAAHVAVFMASDVHNPRGLLFVFQRPPSPDVLRDTWQLLLGSRVVAMFCTAVACPLPIIPHLLVSAFALHRCRLSEYICGCPLLQHIAWQRRIAAVHSSIHKLPLLVPDRGPLVCDAQGAGSTSQGAGALDCRVFVTFMMLLGGLVAPTLLMARVNGPQRSVAAVMAGEANAAGAAGSADTAGTARASLDSRDAGNRGSGSEGRPDHSGRVAGAGSSGGSLVIKWQGARLWAAAQAAASRAARCLRLAVCRAGSIMHHLCELLLGASGGVLAVAAWWMLLSLLWVAALLLEGASQPAASAA